MCDESAIYEFFTEKSMHHDGFNETLLRHMDWLEAADLIVRGMEGANLLKCSGFGDAIIENM